MACDNCGSTAAPVADPDGCGKCCPECLFVVEDDDYAQVNAGMTKLLSILALELGHADVAEQVVNRGVHHVQ